MRARRQLSSRTRRRAKEPKTEQARRTVALDADTIAVLGHLRTLYPDAPSRSRVLRNLDGNRIDREAFTKTKTDPLETRRRGVWLGLAGTRHLQPQALVLHLRDREQPARSPGSYVDFLQRQTGVHTETLREALRPEDFGHAEPRRSDCRTTPRNPQGQSSGGTLEA
jgi:hypothetical protein